MKKGIVLFAFAIICISMFVACDGGSSPAIDSSSAIVLDATNLTMDSISVSSQTHISLQNMDPTKMYSVRTTGNSKYKSRGAVSTSGVFRSGESTFIPVPDNDNKSEFSGNDLEIQGSGSIQIVEIHTGEGPMIVSEDDDPVSYYKVNYQGESETVYEKFFHVDFTKAPYDNIDKSRVALLMYDLGGGSGGTNWGYVTMGAGGLEPEGFTPGLYDFSKFDYVNLYVTMSIIESSSPWSEELILMNPVVCQESVPHDIAGQLAVYSFTPSSTTTPYVMVVHKPNNDYDYSDPSNLRTIDGNFVDFTLCLKHIETEAVHYLGCLSTELLVDLRLNSYSNNYSREFGSVEFRPATAEEIAAFNSHIISVNYDKTVFSHRFEVGKYSDFTFYLQPKGNFVPNNSIMKVEYKYDDGSYATGNFITYASSGHVGGVGHSGSGLSGSYSEFICTDSSYLVEVSAQSFSPDKPVAVTFTLERSETVLNSADEPSRTSVRLFVVPNNGSSIKREMLPIDSEYTVPNLTWKGHTFKGYSYCGDLYAPGTKFIVDSFYSSAVGVWD